MIDFSKMPCLYWSDITKCSYLQRRILVHSILYYELNESVITDQEFDSLCKQLLVIQENIDQEEYQQTKYYEQFKSFEGSTGFDLYESLSKQQKEYLTEIAISVLSQFKR